MAQHFLLSPTARALRDADMQHLAMDEGTAYVYFMLMRWGSLTEQICPKCGLVAAHTPRVAHKQWRCKGCRHDFSLKSGTPFQGTRLSFGTIFKAMWVWSRNSKGTSAVELIKALGIGYEAAYLLLHKFRWAMFTRSMEFKFQGQVELDVVWVFKHVRKFNDRSDETRKKYRNRLERKIAVRLMRQQPGLKRKKARALANKKVSQRPPRENPKKRPLLSIAQRGSDGKILRSIGILLEDECIEEIAPVVLRFVAPGTQLFTDGEKDYTPLGEKYKYPLTQVNHGEHYSEGDGKHSNGVESGFARWRRMEKGVYHRMNARTIQWFYAECAWREEHRRADPVQRFIEFTKCLLSVGVCRPLKKYGYEQVQREFKARQIPRMAAPLPQLSTLATLVKTGLLEEKLMLEVEGLQDGLTQRASFSGLQQPRISSWDRRAKLRSAGIAFAIPKQPCVPGLVPAPYKVSFTLF